MNSGVHFIKIYLQYISRKSFNSVTVGKCGVAGADIGSVGRETPTFTLEETARIDWSKLEVVETGSPYSGTARLFKAVLLTLDGIVLSIRREEVAHLLPRGGTTASTHTDGGVSGVSVRAL